MESFNDLNLSPELKRAILELGFEKPSEIQQKALPLLLADATDFIGLAATGTGKTAAFGIPLIEKIDSTIKKVQAIILCPTRELALQVCGQINLLGKYKGVRSLPIYGGSGYREQIDGLRRGDMIVVGTPGRVIDHIQKGTLKLDNVKTVILDEADEMISMGFKEELDLILSNTSRDTSKIWLFSATMSREVRRVADTYLRNPALVQINRTEMLSQTVDQVYYVTQEQNKPEVLLKLIETADDFYGVIFCQTKALVSDLTDYLIQRSYKVDCLHGDKDQSARERTMKSFRDRRVNILVCTDVAARGLDVKDLSHVINFSIPRELDSYVHRIGRTARSGKSGIAMSLVSRSQRSLIGRIEFMTKSKMREGVIPTRKDVGAKKVTNALSHFQAQKDFKLAEEVLSDSWKTQIADMSKEEIVARFLTQQFSDFFSEKASQKDQQSQDQQQNDYGSDESRQPRRRSRAARYQQGNDSRGGGGGGGGGYGGGDRQPRRFSRANDQRPTR